MGGRGREASRAIPGFERAALLQVRIGLFSNFSSDSMVSRISLTLFEPVAVGRCQVKVIYVLEFLDLG